MRRRMFLSKIHRATITHADLHYEGSCTVDATLMERAGILPGEELHVWNIARGTRIITYALPAPHDSGVVCINGAAAHLNEPGDLVILATFGEMSDEEARTFEPKVVLVNDKNQIVEVRAEVPGPRMSAAFDEAKTVVPTA